MWNNLLISAEYTAEYRQNNKNGFWKDIPSVKNRTNFTNLLKNVPSDQNLSDGAQTNFFEVAVCVEGQRDKS